MKLRNKRKHFGNLTFVEQEGMRNSNALTEFQFLQSLWLFSRILFLEGKLLCTEVQWGFCGLRVVLQKQYKLYCIHKNTNMLSCTGYVFLQSTEFLSLYLLPLILNLLIISLFTWEMVHLVVLCFVCFVLYFYSVLLKGLIALQSYADKVSCWRVFVKTSNHFWGFRE